MYALGMSVREIRMHLEELYGIDVSPVSPKPTVVQAALLVVMLLHAVNRHL